MKMEKNKKMTYFASTCIVYFSQKKTHKHFCRRTSIEKIRFSNIHYYNCSKTKAFTIML